jgi:hypothetical protein
MSASVGQPLFIRHCDGMSCVDSADSLVTFVLEHGSVQVLYQRLVTAA